MTTTNNTVKLSGRDLAILLDVCRYKFLTSHQLHALYFAGATHENATKRLTALHRGDMLSRTFNYPKSDRETIRAHPTAIYYFAPANQKRLKSYLETNGNAGAWRDFEAALHTHTKAEEFSRHYLVHELGISEFFLSLERATKETEGVELVFWERTSPFSKGVGEKLSDETGERYHFNPDAFFALRVPEGHAFFFLEYDNNTQDARKYRKKLQGYIAYAKQNRFSELLRRYAAKYLLPVQNFERAGFRVLTITPDEKRRDELFLASLPLESFKRLLFASIEEAKGGNVLAPIWTRGKEFAPIAEARAALPKEITPALQSRWLGEKMKTMSRVSLLDT